MNIESFLIFASSTFMMVGTYFIWFSRYNIPNHLVLGSLFVAYLVPVFLTNVLTRFPPEIVTQYAYILAVGSVFYVVGLVFGNFYIPVRRIIKVPPFFHESLEVFLLHRYRFLIGAASLALVTMALCWVSMGMVPMFAADPFAAKFFKGEYFDAYMRVAIPYRLAQTVQITLFPILVALWFVTRKKLLLVVVIMIMLFFALALNRGLVFYGLFMLMALYAAKKRSYLFWFIIAHITIISVGSAIYYLAAVFFGADVFGVIGVANSDVWQILADGSPDIVDQLTLLQTFENHGTYTLGRTFYGGLIPGQYYWNPSAWSLYISNNTDDISEVTSGGFRVPVALWGYFSFGWIGVMIVPFMSGVILGAATKFTKYFVSHKNILTSILALTFYTVVLAFFWNFYIMSMYAVPACVLIVLVLYRIKLRSASR